MIIPERFVFDGDSPGNQIQEAADGDGAQWQRVEPKVHLIGIVKPTNATLLRGIRPREAGLVDESTKQN